MSIKHSVIIATIALLGLAGCTTPVHLDHLDHPIGVIAHGGTGTKSGSVFLPYNTMASFQKGLNIFGADGVEMDVQLTRDNQLVLYHNSDLGESTDCDGLINARLIEECRTCRYTKPWYSLGSEQYPILALEDLFQYITARADTPYVVFDLKLHPAGDMDTYQNNMATAISNLLTKYHYTKHTFIESTHTEILQTLKKVGNQLQVFLYAGEAESGIKTASEMGFYGITMNYRLLTAEQVQKAHDAGLRVAVFGTTSRNQNRVAANLRPDFIQTDNVPFLKELLDPYNP